MGIALVPPTGRISFLLQRAQQLGLQIDRQLADFVQKHGAALGDRQQPVLGFIGAGEGALDVAEQLALDQGRNQRAAVHRNKRLVAVRPGVVNRARHQLLAGAALAQDQHRMRAVRRLGDDAVKLLHLRRAADDRAEAFLGLDLLAQDAVFAGELQMPDHALQQQPKLFQVERLGDIVVGAVLHRLHRRLHGGVAGDDDDHGLRTAALDLAQNLQPAGSRKP